MKRMLGIAAAALCCLVGMAQSALTAVSGVVTDSASGEPVVMASVFLAGPDVGCSTDEQGRFYLSSKLPATTVRVSALGYVTQTLPVKTGRNNHLNIKLGETSVTLGEVVVKRKKEKYTKKDNPAVALAKRLIARRHQGDPRQLPCYEYEQYDRVAYGLDNFVGDTVENHALEHYRFLQQFTDTVEASGRTVLPVSIKERVALERYSRGHHEETLLAQCNDGVDESFDRSSLERFLNDVFGEVDIFQNDIAFMKNRFVSPLSSIGVSFYKYYLNDTAFIDGERCVELSFVPFANQTFGYLGRLWVTVDTTLFIKKVILNVPHAINLNFVDRVFIEQEFKRGPQGTRLKTREDMTVEFMLFPNSQGLYARRSSAYSRHRFTPAPEQAAAVGGTERDSVFWTEHRPVRFKTNGDGIQLMMRHLRKDRLYYWGEKFILASIHDYFPTRSTGSKIDIGPVTSILSGNDLEGFRIKLGAMTTAQLHPHWFGNAWVAYGFKDKRWKYMGRLTYSIPAKQLHSGEWPMHKLSLEHRYDVEHLGRRFLYVNADNSLMAITRHKDRQLAYLRTTRLAYTLELPGGFSAELGMEHNRHEASRYVRYIDGDSTSYSHYNEAGFTVALRYAPGEQFYQARDYRSPINYDHPVITLRHTYMPRGLMGSKWEINKTELGMQQRFWFSAFGYADLIVKGEKIWSRVSFPDLIIPNANLSYTIMPESFSLMDVMEFVCDQSVSWDLTYWMNGALLNRLPVIKKLKLREVFSFRGVYGSLSRRNDPDLRSDLLRWPQGAPCRRMDGKPYMEVSVGLDNILHLFRVDYVWRLSHRDTPGVDRSGVRFQLHFNF